MLLFILMPSVSSAATAWGSIKGRLMFYNNQGNYCKKDGRDCRGATYPQYQYRINRPVRDTKIYLRRSSDNAIIGQGTTDAKGLYTIWWKSLGTESVSARIFWHGEHKNGRFTLKASNGSLWSIYSNPKKLKNKSITWIPYLVIGNSKSPHPMANLYDGAFRMWKDGLNQSNLMRSRFTNVEIRAFDSSVCSTSCAYGNHKKIIIDSAHSAYMPQARVMHEMGHIASYISNPRIGFSDYTHDGKSGWHMYSAEYASVGFEEALATFYADSALYKQWNKQPLTCVSSGACPKSAYFNVENKNRASCYTNEERWAITVNRYLRDIYDSYNYKEKTDRNTEPFHHFFTAIKRFNNGFGNRGKNEPYEYPSIWWLLPSVDDKDGRSAVDFRAHMEALTGHSTYDNYLSNCTPVGD